MVQRGQEFCLTCLVVSLLANQALKASMTPTLKTAAITGAIFVAAIALNPSAERHRTQIKESIAERSPLAGLLGVGALAAFASNYHSLGVASYTSIRDETVSFGFLGMVFVIDSHKDH